MSVQPREPVQTQNYVQKNVQVQSQSQRGQPYGLCQMEDIVS